MELEKLETNEQDMEQRNRSVSPEKLINEKCAALSDSAEVDEPKDINNAVSKTVTCENEAVDSAEEEGFPVDLPTADFVDDDNTDEDDTVNVIIKPPNKGSIYKTGTTYQARSQNIAVQGQKPLRQGVNINEPGNIQGVPTIEFSLSSLGDEEKPWKRPGADITDYFNYGFTEDTWTQYCEKQKLLRQEYANTALKPVILGTAAGLGVRYSHHKDIGVLGGRARSYSGSDEELDKRDGLLGHGQGFSVPPPGYAPALGADALSQFSNAATAAAFSLPPPGFPNTTVPPPIIGSGFPSQQPGHQWQQSNMGSGLISLFSGQPIRSASGRNHTDSRKERTPENVFSDGEYNEPRRSRYRGDEEQDGRYVERYDRDQHRSNRRSRSRSRDHHYGGRSRRYREDSLSHDHGRHGERSSRRRTSRERRRDRSPRNRDGSLAPSVGATESSTHTRTSRGEAHRRSDRDSRRNHHRHRRTSRHRSHSSQMRDDGGDQMDSVATPLIDPLKVASAAAADISEKIRRATSTNETALS